MDSQTLIKTHSKQSKSLQIALGTVFGISIYFWDFFLESFIPISQRYILTFLPCVIILSISLFSFFKKANKSTLKLFISDKLNILCLFSLGFGIVWNLFYRGDTSAVLQVGLFWASIIGYKLFTTKYPVYSYTFLFALILLIIPYVITSNNPSDIQALTPSSVNQGKAFVISIHFSSVLGGILLLFGLYKLTTKKRSFPDILMIIFGSYLVVFAQSRTTLLAIIISVILGLIFQIKNKVFVFFLSLFFILSIYVFTPIIQQNPALLGGLGNSSFTRTFLKIDNTERSSGISSGREWLWRYHISLFNQFIWTGAPRNLLDFKSGDLINGEIATAGSESFFTYVLARYGIWGTSYYIFFLMLLWKSINSGEQEFYLLMIYSIISCAGISLLGNPYGSHNIAVYLYIFSLSHLADLKEEKLHLRKQLYQKAIQAGYKGHNVTEL